MLRAEPGLYLVLTDGGTGEVYASFPVNDGDSFSIGFIHSVNKNPVIDVYHIVDGTVYVEETIYYSFGAGVQTELNAGERLDFGIDGAMIVSNVHRDFLQTGLRYLVGAASDHTLFLGDVLSNYPALYNYVGVFTDQTYRVADIDIISLSELCGRKSVVTFTCEYRLFR